MVSVVHRHSGVIFISNFFLGLHVPCVKETPSLGFSGDGLLLSFPRDNTDLLWVELSLPMKRSRMVPNFYTGSNVP